MANSTDWDQIAQEADQNAIENDVYYKLGTALGGGPLSALDRNSFETGIPMRFPLDVGGEEYPHYLLFNILVPQKTRYSEFGGSATSTKNISIQGGNTNINETLRQTAALVEAGGQLAQEGLSGLPKAAATAIIYGSGQLGKIVRDYKTLQQTIRLYVPETSQQTLSNQYNAVSLTEAMGLYGLVMQNAGSVGTSLSDLVNRVSKDASEAIQDFNFGKLSGIPGQIMNTVTTTPGILEGLASFADPNLANLIVQKSGMAINPQMEILYESPRHREYVFRFKLTPRSQQESIEIAQIIRAFKFHSSPELSTTGGGRYYIPPSIFEISYMFNKNENKALHKFLPCVLTSIDVNYVTTGQFATYSDGTPIETEMTLQFQEIDVITKELVEKGY